MDNIQTYRLVLFLTKRVEELENIVKNNDLSTSSTSQPIDLSEINKRIDDIEVNVTEISRRLGEVEARPVVDVTEINRRLGEVEKRPELTQRLSALELTVATLNN